VADRVRPRVDLVVHVRPAGDGGRPRPQGRERAGRRRAVPHLDHRSLRSNPWRSRPCSQRLTQVGVIRLGQQLVSKNGKKYPAKLETLRFTVPVEAADRGRRRRVRREVKPWQAPTGPQWEVITGVKEIPVLVPPQRIDPNMEHWGNGYRSRMCDGETGAIRQKPCLCAAAIAAGANGRSRDVCKPTTRMSLMLAEIPSLGTWKLEAHGWNAAAELPTLAASIESAPQPIPARLEVQAGEEDLRPERRRREQVESRCSWSRCCTSTGSPRRRRSAANWAPQPAPPWAARRGTARHRSGEGPESARRKFTPQEYMTLAESAEEIDDVRELWTDAATTRPSPTR
jgi:hypothetical protein